MNKKMNLFTAFMAKVVSKIFICCLILLLGVATVVAAPLSTLAETSRYVDMVFVVDESGSMDTEHNWLGVAVADLEAALVAEGIGAGEENHYGLVGFGVGSSNEQRKRYEVGGPGEFFGNSDDLINTLDQLTLRGDDEDGYAGMDEALSYEFRPTASVNIVLVTDEDRYDSDSGLDFESMLEKFSNTNNSALLNAVVDLNLEDGEGADAVGVDGNGNAYIPDGSGGFVMSSESVIGSGYYDTKEDYADLAWATQSGDALGAVWDLKQLRAGGDLAQSFSAAFTAVKVQEIELSTPVKLEEEGEFDVPANSETGRLVYSGIESESASDFCFQPSGQWSQVEGLFVGPEGDPGVDSSVGFTYSNPGGFAFTAYSLAATDALGLKYEIDRNPALPLYQNDAAVFRMNDEVGQYGDNTEFLTVHYWHQGENGKPHDYSCPPQQ